MGRKLYVQLYVQVAANSPSSYPDPMVTTGDEDCMENYGIVSSQASLPIREDTSEQSLLLLWRLGGIEEGQRGHLAGHLKMTEIRL